MQKSKKVYKNLKIYIEREIKTLELDSNTIIKNITPL